jgi:site-specific DNA recombinase
MTRAGKTRAAIYARVSSTAQRENQTIESQLRVLPSFVKSQGWQLVGTYIDDGKSAKAGKLDKRDGFARLAKDAAAGAFDVLVVIDIDRLTRTDDMRERAAILGPFQTANIRIVTPNGGELDLRTMLGEMYVTMQAMFAAEENKKRAERTKRGQIHLAQNGGKPSGRTPYGLRYNNAAREWSLDPERAKHVREIFRRVIAGDSCRTIALDFEARDVPPPSKRWEIWTVHTIATARYPIGEWMARHAQRIMVRVPAILDESTWQQAQRAIARTKLRGLRRTKHFSLLEGIATCGDCGALIMIHARPPNRGIGEARRSYCCKRRRRGIRGETRRCDADSVSIADVDARVWEIVCRKIKEPTLVDQIEAVDANRAQNRKAWARDVEKYKSTLDRLVKAEQAFLARFAKGTISEQALDGALDSLQKERGVIGEQLATAERAASSDASEVSADKYVAGLLKLAKEGTPEARQRVVRAVVRQAAIVDGRVRIVMIFDAAASEGANGGFAQGSSSRTPNEATGPGLTVKVVA